MFFVFVFFMDTIQILGRQLIWQLAALWDERSISRFQTQQRTEMDKSQQNSFQCEFSADKEFYYDDLPFLYR